MSRLSKIGAACLAAFGWSGGVSAVTASYLVVAGGGGGGNAFGGGGGAGGYQSGTASLNPTLSYTVTVGGGGGGSTLITLTGTSGSNSVFNSVTSTGGGGGGSNGSLNGLTGGSGGGGAGGITGGGAAGISGQGNNGGAANGSSPYGAGGGGGAGAVGGSTSGSASGAGGNGSTWSVNSVVYAGGGGGGGNVVYSASAGAGGTGGGGAGVTAGNGLAGTANLGGGGGGGGYTSGSGSANFGGNGGAGVVIISYPAPQQFGGGVVTTSGSNVIHTFNTSGTLTPLSSLTASYLIVAGGGGGGSATSGTGGTGAGGAGGLLSGSGLTIDSNSIYVVTVGAGGGVTSNAVGTQGTNSSLSAYATSAVGGGYGGKQSNGGAGGSGGGAGYAPYTGGTATSGQGYAGGDTTASSGGGAGGGGAGAAGVSATTASGSNGGVGIANPITGSTTGQLVSTTYYVAGGGGGGAWTAGSPGSGGNGGGGGGGTNAAVAGVSGTANTGGGGGGGGGTYSVSGGAGGSGGSGVVIISYAGSTQQMAGGTVTITGGNVIHTFTSSGYLTPIKYVNNSLRFRSSASAYLNRTMGTPTNSAKWTWSFWLKRGKLAGSDYPIIYSAGIVAAEDFGYFRAGTEALWVVCNSVTILASTQVFRDTAAWYNMIFVFDGGNATASNRLRVYLNGVEITAWATDIRSTLTSSSSNVNKSGTVHRIATDAYMGAGDFYDGYMTEINFIDGQALTPNSFGTFNSYGVWQPITYGGSYGTNGFYLPFTNNTNTTTIGYDFSPNGNNWTPNNISGAFGTTLDYMTDVPTLTSATAANYCVWNPLSGITGTLSEGNLYFVGPSSYVSRSGTIALPTSGKIYFEATLTVAPYTPRGSTSAYNWVGVALSTNFNITSTPAANQVNGLMIGENGYLNNFASSASDTGTTFVVNDVIGFAIDTSANTYTIYRNNSSIASGTIGVTAGTSIIPMQISYNADGGAPKINFGQRPFSYTPPTGYVALNTYNM